MTRTFEKVDIGNFDIELLDALEFIKEDPIHPKSFKLCVPGHEKLANLILPVSIFKPLRVGQKYYPPVLDKSVTYKKLTFPISRQRHDFSQLSPTHIPELTLLLMLQHQNEQKST